MQQQSDFRQRAFLPLMIPLAIVGVIALSVGTIAAILTFLPQEVGNVVAFMVAAGILASIALAASQDSLEPLKKGGAALAVVVPLVFGAVLAVGGICDGDDIVCPSEFEPAIRFPAWAPIVVSTQPAAFDNQSVTLPPVPPEEAEQLAIVFQNDSNISHNLYLSSTMERPAEESGLLVTAEGEPALTPTFTSGSEAVFFVPPTTGEYLYYCSIHEGMDGTLTIEDGAEPAVDGEPVAAR